MKNIKVKVVVGLSLGIAVLSVIYSVLLSTGQIPGYGSEHARDKEVLQAKGYKRVYVNDVNMEIFIPEDCTLTEGKLTSGTTNEVYAYTFNIRNYEDGDAGDGSQVEGLFFLSGEYQLNAKPINAKKFYESEFEVVPSTRKEFTVDKLPAVSGITDGRTDLYIIRILRDGRIMTVATKSTDRAAIERTDEIINSIDFK